MIINNKTLGVVSISLSLFLTSCGGGGGNDSDNGGSSRDTTPPSGYSVSFTTDPIDETNEMAVAFSVIDAEVGSSYEYTLSSDTATLNGSGTVSQASFDVTGLELSGFPPGVVDLNLTLTDVAGNTGNTASDTAEKTSTPTVVTLSGRVTYDFVPHDENTFGLDYDATEQRPVRGATLQVLDSGDLILAEVGTDENGEYSVSLSPEQSVKVRVRAEILGEGDATWDFRVTDNTNSNALYVLDGDLAEIGMANQTRDLHAPSGWDEVGNTGYTEERAAAPFAILDTVYLVVEKLVEIDSDIQMPAAEFRWSENNTSEEGDRADGAIRTSSYVYSGNEGNVYLMGNEDVNTDEYDRHVIVHEFGHYFEHQLSRSDSIGGSHSLLDFLDLRVAFAEGWGNAFAGMILDDSEVKDSAGAGQASAYYFDLEWNRIQTGGIAIPGGWYNEFSVHAILYDLHDGNAFSDSDFVEMGLARIYETLVNPDYIEQGTLTTIHSFLAQLKLDHSEFSDNIDDFAESQDIFGQGFQGEGETNDAGMSDILPIYTTAEVNGAAVTVCTTNEPPETELELDIHEYNRLGNTAFILVDLPSSGTYTFEAERVSGILDADPEILLNGPFPPLGEEITRFSCGRSETGTTESMTCSSMSAAEHVIEIHDDGNVDLETETGGEVCFDVTVTD